MNAIKRILMERQGHSEVEANRIVEDILDEAEDIVSGDGSFDGIGDMLMSDWQIDADHEFSVLEALATRVR